MFEDADLDLAVDLAVEQFDNSGQVCLAAVRMLVQDTVYDEFRTRFLAKAATITQGDSREESTDIGPLVSRTHFDRVDGFVTRAIAEGAQVILGGEPNHELTSPAALLQAHGVRGDSPPTPRSSTEEVFGPVLTIQTFATEEEGVAMANDTEYGLAATLVTGDPTAPSG